MEFAVDDELAALIEKLAKPKPFENLTFNAALWKVMREYVVPAANGQKPAIPALEDDEPEIRVPDAVSLRAAAMKKAASPSPTHWAQTVPELKQHRHLTTWKAICDHLDIDTGQDSARRKLLSWVATNKPKWPPVPDID